MKKLFVLMTVVLVICAMFCFAYADDTASDILVMYFSRTGEQYTVGVIDKGNTAIAAEMIAEQTGADLFEVLPVDDH